MGKLDVARRTGGDAYTTAVRSCIPHTRGSKQETEMKNECGKTRDVENPYETWVNDRAGFEWRVLKKYQRPDKEAANPYARWLVAARSPYTYGSWEYGDTYVSEIKSNARKVA